MAEAAPPDTEPRPLSPPLLAGILILPVVFFWFLLRPGYSNSLRVGAFLYMALSVGGGLLASRF